MDTPASVPLVYFQVMQAIGLLAMALFIAPRVIPGMPALGRRLQLALIVIYVGVGAGLLVLHAMR